MNENIVKEIFYFAALTKVEFRKLVRTVQSRMMEKEFDMVFWLVSSHGGMDHFGEYFMDTNFERQEYEHS